MIVSHRHRFIFLKTRKTAGSSVELALSALCGPEDIITRVAKREEPLRLGRPPQNFVVRVPSRWWHRLSRYGGEPRYFVYYDHVPAGLIKKHITTELWRRYTKVTIVRNPWDREISRYFYAAARQDRYADFAEFVRRRTRWHPMKNYRIHSINGRNIADVVLRYEHLDADFESFVRSLGVDELPELPRANSESRPHDARDYRMMYGDLTRRIVERVYAREIQEFGYEF
jgi:hypothetical protein